MKRERPYKLAVFMGGARQQVSYAYRKNRDERARGYKRAGIETRKWDVRRLPKVSA